MLFFFVVWTLCNVTRSLILAGGQIRRNYIA